MCVIILKPYGAAIPDETTIADCWESNPDGAGLAISRPGDLQVFVSKGYMSLADFRRALDSIKDAASAAIMYHFRVATHGGICQHNCHPFPYGPIGPMRKLQTVCGQAIAHNGIFNIPLPKGATHSDSMAVIAEMASLGMSPVEYAGAFPGVVGTGKIASLLPGARYSTVGDWKTSDGLLFSNLNHAAAPWPAWKGWTPGKWASPYANALDRDDI